MKSIGNIASKIHVSPKLNLNYKRRCRFRLSLNQQFHTMWFPVIPLKSVRGLIKVTNLLLELARNI